ncbi:AMP-dependent synthetase and ligase family protein [Gossypium australe]|uniref:AMP-dependent synthetase and ligase family protein n=1 Tax=Gossypium australe TaxID=47621 RepID=A0A5B6X8Y6_9ROSI|nr:AMP-dependent synthetase and ligase family protein [Gossypium australe]
MELAKPIEDQFSKLHPCLPVNTSIGILGAGPSGISAAYALIKLGYNNITLLEKHHTVGGMCESVDIQGKVYDLGGQVLAANSAPVIFHLAKEIGAELEEMDSHKLALIDSSAGKYQDIKVADDYVSMIALTLELQDKAKASSRIGVHAVSDLAADLTPTYLEAHGFKSVPKSVFYGYTASGYGYVQDMPYAYIHEFTRTSMAGKIRRFKGGYTSFWEKISKNLPVKVLCNTEVLAIRHNDSADGVSINVKNIKGESEVMEFDKIIVSGAFPFKNGKTYRSPASNHTEHETQAMDLNDLEKELFSKVMTIDYYTTVLKIKGLEDMPVGFYYFGEYMDDPASIGHPVAMQRFYADSDIFLFWSYGNSLDIQGSTVCELAIKAVEPMGGQVEQVVLQRRFKYFPHVSSQDMKNGFYERLESELQGKRNTYYVGGLMAFELTERNSSYAMALICKHFANNKSTPVFPYVKNLKQLGELPGVEFPDLCTLDGYLKRWGTHEVTQSKTLYTWINEEGAAVGQRTYAELHANASFIAQKILTSKKPVIRPGDRVLLVYVPGLDFVDAFFGCLRAKVLPVPVLPPDPLQRGGQALMKIENISKSCGAVAILSTIVYHSAVRAGLVKQMISLTGKKGKSSANWPNLTWLHTDSWIKNFKKVIPDATVDPSEPHPDDLCFLQFTSGSTGDAKGVMITHGGLIHNVKLMRKRYKSTSKTVLISWLPQYHDMGLIGGLFTAMVSGGSAVLFSPMTFIRNPLLWLQTMSKYKATHSAGPNFAFELVVRRLESDKDKAWNYDLSSLIFLMVAAEPVRQRTLKRFIELTYPFGLSQEVMAPGYGLAENCVFVSCAFGEGSPILVDWQGRVCCGYTDLDNQDVDIRIVDPETGVELEEGGKEGEIWISSPSSGIGYWGREEHSHQTFRNELKNHSGRKYTRTGDLGRIVDGKLFITGRIKDLIIVAGRNIYSADVEKTVESSSEVIRPGCCAVIGVPEDVLSEKGIPVPDGADHVGLVVIAEVRDGKPVKKEVIEQIKTRVAEEHGVSIAAIKLIKPKTISKTTSGKIKRFECLKQFSEGTLNIVPEPIFSKRTLVRSFTTGTCAEGRTPRQLQSSPVPSTRLRNKDIVEFLKGLVSELTGIPTNNISAVESLVSYGIDSIGVVRASQKLSDFLGVPVGAVDIFTATCIADLANFSENLLVKSKPDLTTASSFHAESDLDSDEPLVEVSIHRQVGIWILQFLALTFVSILLSLPAYLSVSAFTSFTLTVHATIDGSQWLACLIYLAFAPLVWILCIALTCLSISFLGNPFLRPNYALIHDVSIWSVDFVKWWALYKAQQIASKVLAQHLRGTVFLNYWFEMLGARIGPLVTLDTIDITDPSLVSIGDGAVVSEGALIQSHEVKNGILGFQSIRIGKNSTIGPYAVIQKGSVVAEEAEVLPLQRIDGGTSVNRSAKATSVQKSTVLSNATPNKTMSQFMGIYLVGFLSSFSAAILYFLYIWLSEKPHSLQHFAFACISGALHWIPFTVIAYAIMFASITVNPASFAVSVAISYLAHGLILSFLTGTLTRLLTERQQSKQSYVKIFIRHRITIACHLRFAHLLSGTEAFCMYLRLLGAKVGRHCSIRAINPISDPELVEIGAGVHLGDFSRIITGFYTRGGLIRRKVEVQDNSVVGSQSLVLPGSRVENDVILGALSVAPENSLLQRGGVYVGSQTPIMVKNTNHALDDRIEEMDMKYKKIVGNLAASLAVTTLKVKSRYFHRIGVAGNGYLKIYEKIEGFPDHNIFHPGKSYRVVVRHSNSLSADDDARIDARGAAIRIHLDENNDANTSVLDLTLKTGKAFYARTIADFATWLVCGLPAREEHVKRVPHIRDAVWMSLRHANSYAELHYYSNFVRLLRFSDGEERYVKFKLRPYDGSISEESGKVEPKGILPPETGAIPRDENDTRPLLFLAQDFQRRVNSGGVRYIFQLQVRPVPSDEAARDVALDCTKPWDETEFPYIDVGEINLERNLTAEEAEALEFNPFRRCHVIDVIRASMSSQSASIDHGRSLIYEICQRLRNKEPLPEAWRIFLEQSDVKVDLSGCPMAAALEKKDTGKVTLERNWYQTSWSIFVQPLLQTVFPYSLLGLAISAPLTCVLHMKESEKFPLHWLLPLLWVSSGIVAAITCAVAKWVLVGKKNEAETVRIWSKRVFMDTIWQAFRTLVGDYFMEMSSGSIIFLVWMKLMGSDIEVDQGMYVDSMGALLNPEMVDMERGGCVGRDALLFGHIYEGEGGKVKFGKIRIGEGGYIGSRAVAMPGVRVESGGNLTALTLAMKEEIVK